MGSRNKNAEDFFANMPNPDAIFQSWWPFIIAGTVGTIYGVRQWVRGPKCIGGSRMKGKTIIVTGANGGIGKEIALQLAHRGGKVIMACRDAVEGKKAAEFVRKETENMDVYFMKLDLNSFKSIREFVEKFKKKESNLHLLINNAGVMMCPQEKTEDGFDVQFQTNYLGPFLLTELLLDILKASAPSRIINTTASAHNLGDINFDDINLEKKQYSLGDVYAQSKLAVVLHTFQLAERLKDTKVTCNVVNPGICNTDIYRYLPLKSKKFIRVSFAPFMWFLMKYPEDGAQISIYLSTADELAETSGKHFKDAKEQPLSGKCLDKLLQEQLYRASLKWIEQSKESQIENTKADDVDNSHSKKSETKSKTDSSMERVQL
ncbi:retinol dehydrogenase 13-like [Biomphalaria glabrata]|uniref:Retinol dehydrogenase 13-like n=1 Tax=Biomphalaria glabrata TaxID=6526 RepID=A0A2C9MAR6_BIOGL|nr:retinol dehydrogenase 13-like [Biomphalaria glabrata]KAI8787826.1 retinol dehydrogenase 13 [Biomphalaria glabrata]